MRNLKRALSLTLASVMLLGMMVIGTSAASFTDADQISNVTAATVLQELEVMQGSNGKFSPNQTVTRGQMAILICKMLYGSKLNAENFAGTSEFTDVPANAYYTGYVNLASQLGIISGYGNGKFGPGAPVTTAQAALMLTRALGWFQAGELENQSWTSNAIAAVEKATSINLFGSMKLANNDPLSCDNVCEMVFNAMTKTAPVNYNSRWEMYYSNDESIMTGVKFQYTDSLGYRNFTLVYNTTTDDFKHPATEWGIGTGARLDVDNNGDIEEPENVTIRTSFVKSADEADLTYTAEVKGKDIYADLGKPTIDNVYYYINSEDDTTTAPKAGFDVANGNDEKIGGNGVLIEVYRDDDDVKVVIVNTYVAKVDGDFNESKKELAVKEAGDDAELALPGGVSYKLSSDDLDNLDSFSDGDYVLLTISDDEVKTIEKADVISGELTSYRSDKLTVDGKTYTTTASYKGVFSGDTGVDADLVMDKYGYVIFAKAVDADDEYVYVTEYAAKSGLGDTKYDATLYFVDGTKETSVVDDTGSTNWGSSSSATSTHAGWYTFEKNSDGSYDLEKVAVGDDLKAGTVSSGAVTATDSATVTVDTSGSTTVRANNKTVFIVLKGTTVNVYNGIKEVPDIDYKSSNDVTVAAIMDGSTAEYVFITADDMTVSGGGVADHIYILDAEPDTGKEGDKTVYSYLAVQNGEIVKVNMKSKTNSEESAAWQIGLYTDIDVDDKLIEGATLIKNADDTELKVYTVRGGVEIKEGVLEIANGLVMANSYTIYDCDKDKTEKIDAAELNRNYKGDMDGQVAVVLDDGKVVELYILDDGSAAPAASDGLRPGDDVQDVEDLKPGDTVIGDKTDLDDMDNSPADLSDGKNVMCAFETTAAGQKAILTITEHGESAAAYTEWGTFGSAGGHYFYVSLEGKNGAGDKRDDANATTVKAQATGKVSGWLFQANGSAGTPAEAGATYDCWLTGTAIPQPSWPRALSRCPALDKKVVPFLPPW